MTGANKHFAQYRALVGRQLTATKKTLFHELPSTHTAESPEHSNTAGIIVRWHQQIRPACQIVLLQNTKCFRPGSPRMTCYQPSNKVPLNAAPLSDNLHRMRKEFMACTICADVASTRLVTFKMRKIEPTPKEMCKRSIQTGLCITKRVGNIKIEQKGMRSIKSEVENQSARPLYFQK